MSLFLFLSLLLLPLIIATFSPSLDLEFLVATESAAIHFKRSAGVESNRTISTNAAYDAEHHLNYGPDTIFVRALGAEVRAWIARRTAPSVYTVEFDVIAPDSFWVETWLLHSNYADVDELTTAWPQLLWRLLFRGELAVKPERLPLRAHWHVLDRALIRGAFESLNRPANSRFEERALALARGANWVDVDDCDWRALGDRVILWYGDSQMRTLVFEIARVLGAVVPEIDFRPTTIDFVTPKNLSLRFIQNTFGQYTREQLAAGDAVIFNFGQWPMSGEGHWSVDRYAAQLALVRGNLTRPQRTIWLNTLPFPLRDDHWVREHRDQRSLVRTAVFNRIATHSLASIPSLTRVNVNEIVLPFVDLSNDSAHFRNTPMIAAMARRVMCTVCHLGIWLKQSSVEVHWVHTSEFTANGACSDKSKAIVGHDIGPEQMRSCFKHDQFLQCTAVGNCRHVYIDARGNNGDTVRGFLAGKLPRVSAAEARAYKIYVFEPNPEHHTQYDRFPNVDLVLLKAAAHYANGTVLFAGEGLGGGIAGMDNGTRVPAINFSRWLSETVTPDDYVVCKIDIEGSEYDVLPQMLRDGTLCLCDRLSVEWHAWIVHMQDSGVENAVLDFNHPPGGPLQIPAGDKFVCRIPHLKHTLPKDRCYLPAVVRSVFSLCAAENLEKWFKMLPPRNYSYLKIEGHPGIILP